MRFRSVFALVLPALLCIQPPARALELQRVKTYDLPPEQVVAGQAVVVAETATFRGNAEDDLFACAGEFTLTGILLNDGWIVANSAQIGGIVHDHLRVMANTAILTGIVSNSLVAAGNTVQVTRDSRVSGSANIAGGNIVMEGTVDGPVRIMADQATLGGVVRGYARIYANDIVVLPGTVIEGDLVYTAPNELVLDNRVELRGTLIRKEMDQPAGDVPLVTPLQVVVLQFYLMLAALMLGLPFAGLMPRLTGHAVRLIGRSMLRCSFVGMLAFCLLPMIGAFALMTLVGIPLGIALFALFGIVVYVSKIVVAIALGGMLMRWHGPQSFSRVMLAMILGLVLLYAIAALPVVGLAVWFVVTFVGIGALVLGMFETQMQGTGPLPGPGPSGPA